MFNLNAATTPTRDRRIVTFSRRESFEAEQFRRLRHRLEDLAARRQTKVIAVTSATSGEGKTLTSINLAGALAQSRGSRVLLIDADLRRPKLSSGCGIAPDTPGVVQLLRSGGDLASAVIRLPEASLDVLPCEAQSGIDPYDTLRSSAFRNLIGQARRDYSFVIVDTPPVVPVPDSSVLGPLVDGYLLVVAANRTPRKLLAEALNTLEPGLVLGIVFNRDPEPLFGFYDSHGADYFSRQPLAFEPADA